MIDLKTLLPGDNLRCTNSWLHFLKGNEYCILNVDLHKKGLSISASAQPIAAGMIFIYHFEVNHYFEKIAPSRSILAKAMKQIYDEEPMQLFNDFIDAKPECDCGFVTGVSAVHYRWCSLNELKSA